MESKIKIGISSCLLGENVRWNGDHKRDRYITDVLGKFCEYVPVCPEVEVGMGVPRETVALYGEPGQSRMLGKNSRADWTGKMSKYAKDRLKGLAREELSGFIFKSKSPSCGLKRVPVYSENEPGKARHGVGLFTGAFVEKFPLVPAEDEGRLRNPEIRENFIVRVFGFHRIKKELLDQKASRATLVEFHARHKFLLLAHSRKHLQRLGNIVAEIKQGSWDRALASYVETFMGALALKATPRKNTDALLHMMGFFKKVLPGPDRQDILQAIEDYRTGLIPLIVPMALITHYVRKHKVTYLMDQVYLNPHPKELMLRNHV